MTAPRKPDPVLSAMARRGRERQEQRQAAAERRAAEPVDETALYDDEADDQGRNGGAR